MKHLDKQLKIDLFIWFNNDLITLNKLNKIFSFIKKE